jgi:DNA helicase II / ATP-dependent DNA helicase PcrA
LIAFNPEGESMTAELNIQGEVSLLGNFITEEEEANAVAERVNAVKEDGRKWKDFAVLYRCNHQSRPIEDAMIRSNIPYEIIGSEGFYGRAEIKDVIAYLEVALQGDNLVDDRPFARIVNKPTRYLGKKFSDEVSSEMPNYDGILDCLISHNFRTVNSRSSHNVTQLHSHLCGIREHLDSPADAVAYIRNVIGYDKWWRDNKDGGDMDDGEIMSNLNELSASAQNFKSVESMLNYVAEIQRKYSEKGKANKVKLMSLHRAKGLEFPIVFMVGMSDAFLPHVKSDDVNEERRLAYVGVTRAKEILYLSYYETVRDHYAGPSEFFEQMGIEIEEVFKEVVNENIRKLQDDMRIVD